MKSSEKGKTRKTFYFLFRSVRWLKRQISWQHDAPIHKWQTRKANFGNLTLNLNAIHLPTPPSFQAIKRFCRVSAKLFSEFPCLCWICQTKNNRWNDSPIRGFIKLLDVRTWVENSNNLWQLFSGGLRIVIVTYESLKWNLGKAKACRIHDVVLNT